MNGLLVLDKPSGLTSHDVVAIVRRATGEKSIGHLGTLDPMATGVLPLLLGKYTRLAQFFGQAEKHYEGHIRFGFATDTYDAEGTPVASPLPLERSLSELRELTGRFKGDIDQVPPVYSAKKINGVPAHKLARAGAEVPVKAARITVHRFELTSLEGDVAAFEMDVSATAASTFALLRMSSVSWLAAVRIFLRFGGRGRGLLRLPRRLLLSS